MGLYHAVADVTAKLKNITIGTDPGTVISTAQCEDYILQTEAVVTGRISRKYIMPITLAANPTAYYVIKKICVALTCSDIFQILKLSGTIAILPEEANKVLSFQAEAQELLGKIDSNDLLLSDATRVTAISKNVGYDSLTGNAAAGEPMIQKSTMTASSNAGSPAATAPPVRLQW